eukprot:TRINITY_DN3051_c0_g1_i3.p1 TRINITY_DN3051_c0_g1~~TRINITY_DN3051_c0_g1_i3.p1  ORF type:complete len:655 (-),score=39.55 TRINITY_DN3051_c0_g1_i3:773-2737(-)
MASRFGAPAGPGKRKQWTVEQLRIAGELVVRMVNLRTYNTDDPPSAWWVDEIDINAQTSECRLVLDCAAHTRHTLLLAPEQPLECDCHELGCVHRHFVWGCLLSEPKPQRLIPKDYLVTLCDKDNCTICLVPSVGDGVGCDREPVKHKMHKLCLQRWMSAKREANCPLCHGPLSTARQLLARQTIGEGTLFKHYTLEELSKLLIYKDCAIEGNAFGLADEAHAAEVPLLPIYLQTSMESHSRIDDYLRFYHRARAARESSFSAVFGCVSEPNSEKDQFEVIKQYIHRTQTPICVVTNKRIWVVDVEGEVFNYWAAHIEFEKCLIIAVDGARVWNTIPLDEAMSAISSGTQTPDEDECALLDATPGSWLVHYGRSLDGKHDAVTVLVPPSQLTHAQTYLKMNGLDKITRKGIAVELLADEIERLGQSVTDHVKALDASLIVRPNSPLLVCDSSRQWSWGTLGDVFECKRSKTLFLLSNHHVLKDVSEAYVTEYKQRDKRGTLVCRGESVTGHESKFEDYAIIASQLPLTLYDDCNPAVGTSVRSFTATCRAQKLQFCCHKSGVIRSGTVITNVSKSQDGRVFVELDTGWFDTCQSGSLLVASTPAPAYSALLFACLKTKRNIGIAQRIEHVRDCLRRHNTDLDFTTPVERNCNIQ